MTDPRQTGAPAATVPWDRDVVVVRGPEAERYLQGQLSQDLLGLAPGGSAWALVLQPQGKLDVFARVTRTAPDEFYLDTDAGMGDVLVARLERFKLRTKATIERLEGWGALAVRTPHGGGAPAGEPPVEEIAGPARGSGPYVVARFEWNGWEGFDILAPVGAPTGAQASPDDFELRRILAGFPRHGAELDERTIPAEAGLVQASVSFTKGCYTGQELVARIDSRGSNVPRRLYGLVFRGDGGPVAGQVLVGAEREVGRVTSVAASGHGRWYGLGYANRSFGPGDVLAVQGTSLEVELAELPMPGE